jgi:HSP20 family protein
MLTRWDPFADFARLSKEVFDPEPHRNGTARFVPAVDVSEEKDAFLVRAELPGLKPEDVKIDLDKNVLTLSGERKLEKKDEKDGWRRVERQYGSFARSFVLPETVQNEGIEATMADGILTVKIPKQPKSQPRKIEIKAS